MEKQYCIKCKVELTNVTYTEYLKKGKRRVCKTCHNKSIYEWKNRPENKSRVKSYQEKYYIRTKAKQYILKENRRKKHRIKKDTQYWSDRYNMLKSRCKKRGIYLDINKLDYISWFMDTNKSCEYCGIHESDVHTTKFSRGYHVRLTLDRKNPSLGYIVSNIVFACMTCNLLKNDILSYDEMKEIGEKYIKPKWKKVLLEISQKNY